MVKVFRREKTVAVTAPCQGKLLPLEDVKDAMFSQKLLGDGFALSPVEETICAPCSGKIIMIANSGHAFGIKAKNGAELLIHIGLDTVNLNGQGFHVLKSVNQKVSVGTPIVRLDLAFLKKQGVDLTIPVILTNGTAFHMEKLNVRGKINCGEDIVSITKS